MRVFERALRVFLERELMSWVRTKEGGRGPDADCGWFNGGVRLVWSRKRRMPEIQNLYPETFVETSKIALGFQKGLQQKFTT